jgi:hypothetical protein
VLLLRAAVVPRIFRVVLHRGSAAPVQVITASFYRVGINTHPTPPSEAAGSYFTFNLFQAICELSQTLSL